MELNRLETRYRHPLLFSFLGAFAKLRKATNSLFMSVCPNGTILLPLVGFSWNFIFECFSKIRLQTHTQNMQYFLLFHCNSSCTNASQCYVICTVLVLFIFRSLIPPSLFPFFLPLIFPFFLDSFLTSQYYFHEEIKWSYTVNSYRHHFVMPVVLYRRKNWSLALIEDVWNRARRRKFGHREGGLWLTS